MNRQQLRVPGELGDVRPRSTARPSVANTESSRAIGRDPEIRELDEAELIRRIQVLRRERGAVILAHNYQVPVIQDIADFVGDSLQLSQQAAATRAPVIVFCGVHFMAETAAILCPERMVLIPDPEAGCSLAATVTADEVREWRRLNPNGVVVSYVNTSAAVKAESDYCCTSSNALRVIEMVPPDREVLFLPDMFLGLYVERMTGRRLRLWMGTCHVHAAIRMEDIEAAWAGQPGADLLLHPECGCVSNCMAAAAAGELPADRTLVLSTGGMVAHGRTCHAPADLVGTETGLLHRLRLENPGKTFIPVRDDAVCEYMKTITLAKLYRALRDSVYEVTVAPDVAARARRAIDRMLAAV